MNFWKKPPEPVPMVLRFHPQLDITVYELAFIVSKCDPNREVHFLHGQWEGLGPDIQRHFK